MEEVANIISSDATYSLKIEAPNFTFDGHRWCTAMTNLEYVCLYVAAKARHGDPLAVALLAASDSRIVDCDGKQYWPAPSDEPTVISSGEK